MTFIITHTEGHLACFTVQDDGSLIQHALIDTGTMIHTPQQLVKLGLEMSSKYGWNGHKVDPVERIVAKSIDKAKTRKKSRQPMNKHGLKPGEPTSEQRSAVIKGYLTTHPGPATCKEIIEGLGIEYDVIIQGRWNHFIRRLVRDGEIIENQTIRPYEYTIAHPPITVRAHIMEDEEA